jgi:hypothetical protein
VRCGGDGGVVEVVVAMTMTAMEHLTFAFADADDRRRRIVVLLSPITNQ